VILALLASRDWIASESGADGQIRYRSDRLCRFWIRRIARGQQAHDPRCLPAYDIAALAAAHYPTSSAADQREQALFGEAASFRG